MKSFIPLCFAVSALLIASSACNLLEDNYSLSDNSKHVCKMVFDGVVAGYEGVSVRDVNTKSSSDSWSEGDRVYIAFHRSDAIVPGIAVFSSSEGWSVSYFGDLEEGSSQQCEVRYFVNTSFENEEQVTLTPHSEIYEDITGTFDFNNGTIILSASLKPKVGRIRFTGNSNDRIFVTGISTHTAYSTTSNKFITTSAMIPLEVNDSGSTPYVYGYFTNDYRYLGIVGSDYAYTRSCTSSIYQPGESGYMKIPSSNDHNNWQTGLFIATEGKVFKLLPVSGYSEGFYLLSETETTEAQYYTNSTSQKPLILDYFKWCKWIDLLKSSTQLNFYIPSIEEWQFAANGGNMSQGYLYSGSNNPGEVAWYSSNSSAIHSVKELAPNELGFYDMSGNVPEWTSTVSDKKFFYYVMGGGYQSVENDLKPTTIHYGYARKETDSDKDYHGLRLALKCR